MLSNARAKGQRASPRRREAELIVLGRNPLDDLRVVQDVLLVVSDGEIIVQRGDWNTDRPISE